MSASASASVNFIMSIIVNVSGGTDEKKGRRIGAKRLWRNNDFFFLLREN